MALIFRKDVPTVIVEKTQPEVRVFTPVRETYEALKEDFFRSIQTIKVGADGSVTPSTIDLGYQGDSNVTKIIFDTSELVWNNSSLSNYSLALTFYNTAAPLDENNPLVYEVDQGEFIVPLELTATSISYQAILSIRENMSDGVDGNIDNPSEEEIFISSVINTTCKANTLSWFASEDFFSSAVDPYEGLDLVALVKNKIDLSLLNNVLEVGTNIFGNKMDRYIKYISLSNLPTNTDLDGCWYIYFKNTKTHKLIKIKTASDIIWLPAELTQYAGSIDVTLIGNNPQNEKTIWFNIISGQIADNFLLSPEWLIPNRGSSNLVSSDNYYFVSSDGLTITSAEG